MDLLQWVSPVEDQRDLGSCTGNALANAYELLVNKESPQEFADLSRLFIYYNIRRLDGTTATDSGGYLRDGIKAIKRYGICTEKLWPYNINKFDVEPSVAAYEDAKLRSIKNYRKLANIDDVLDALNNNIPVVFGITVFEDFDYITRRNPIVPMPRYNDPGSGHAMCMVGYDIPKRLLMAKNSFGTKWGYEGYCWIPFEYFADHGYDMWVFDRDTQINPAIELTFN